MKLPENSPVSGVIVSLKPLVTHRETFVAAVSVTELLRIEARFPSPKVTRMLHAGSGLPARASDRRSSVLDPER